MAYTTLTEVRSLEAFTSEEATYSDALITEGIVWASEVIDTYCGTAFESKSKIILLQGNDKNKIDTGIPRILSITAASVTGVAVTDVSAWHGTSDGIVYRDDGGTFTYKDWENVSISVTHGYSTVPSQITYATRALTQWYVMNLVSDLPNNATQAVTEFGTINLALPNRADRPTALPEVNSILNRFRDRSPSIA